MKKLILSVSATQITLFRQCPRLWVNRYIFGLKTPSTAAMEEGLEVHQAIEHYLKTGEVKPGKWKNVVAKLKAYVDEQGLKADNTFVFSEKPIKMKTAVGPWFIGSIDILDVRGVKTGTVPTILDLKSKNNLNYILDEFQLGADIQLAVYALYVMNTYGCETVELRHVYALRDEENPELKIVPGVITRAMAEEVVDGIMKDVDKMVELSQADLKSALDTPGNDASCFAFGKPCHYLESQCETQSPLVGLRVKKKEEPKEDSMSDVSDDDLLAQLGRKKKAEPKTETKTAAPKEEKSHDELVMEAIQKNANKLLRADPNGQVYAKEGADSGWIMRPATPAEREALGIPEPKKEEPKTEAKKETKPKQTSMLDEDDEPSISPPGAPPRTTPKASDTAAKHATEHAMSTGEPVNEPAKKAKPRKHEKVESVDYDKLAPAARRTVYVGCAPIGEAIAALADVLSPDEGHVATELKIAHWGLAQYPKQAAAALQLRIAGSLDGYPQEIAATGAEPAFAAFEAAAHGTYRFIRSFR